MEGLHLASAGNDIKIWDCCNGFSLIHTFNPHCNYNIASLSWNFEGSFLASCAQEDNQVVLTYMKNASLTTVGLPCGTGIQCTDFSSSSRSLLCGGTNGVCVWDLKTKAVIKSFQENKGPVTAARYNWNNSYIASGSELGHIILHNTLTGQSSSPLVASNVQAIRQLEYSAFKKSMFGTASDDGAITLWDANVRRVLHSFKDAHVGPASGFAFSPINEMLMMSVGLDKRIVCYDIQKKHILKVMDAQSPLTCIDIMPDGATAAVGSTRGKVYIFDLRQGGNTPVDTFQAHKTSVRSLKFISTVKSKTDNSGGMKASMTSTSNSKRHLPSPPRAVQDKSLSKIGEEPESGRMFHEERPGQMTELFSPSSQENHSQQSKSAIHLSFVNNQGSFTGVISPLSKGAAELSAASHSDSRGSSLFSMPSFLDQNNSNLQTSHTEHGLYLSLNSKAKSSSLLSTSHLNNKLLSPAMESLHEHDKASVPVSHMQINSWQSAVQDDLVKSQHNIRNQSSFSALPSKEMHSEQDASHPAVEGPLEICEAHNKFRTSTSPDSAAVSGSEDGMSARGIGPKRITSIAHTASDHTVHTVRNSSRGSTAAGPVDVGASIEAEVTQREFLRSLVADAMEDIRDELHRDIQNLHVAMLRQFFNLESTLSRYVEINQNLLTENRQLKKENEILKKNYRLLRR